VNILLLVYSIITASITAIVAEEVRDWRYFAFHILLGFTIIGLTLSWSPWLVQPYRDIFSIILVVLTIITVVFFIKDLRGIIKIQRNSILCEKHALEFKELKTNLRLNAEEFAKACDETFSALVSLTDATIKSLEVLKNG